MMVVSVFSAGMFTVNAVTTQVMLNNCDSADGWEPYPGDELGVTTEKKTEGTGSIRHRSERWLLPGRTNRRS